MQALTDWYMAHLGSHLPREIAVLIISMIPVLELRGGILLAFALKLPIVKAIVFAVIGNLIPIPFILFFIKKILAWMKQFKIFKGLVEKIENKAYKNKDKIQRFEFWGLVAFVGIPAPGTGAWTGSLVAALFDMEIKKAVKAILVGICIATVIMSLITYGVIGAVAN